MTLIDEENIFEVYQEFKRLFFKDIKEEDLFRVGNRVYVTGHNCKDEIQAWDISGPLTVSDRLSLLERLKRYEIMIFMDGGKNGPNSKSS